ncbi:MAG: hypothetical protein BBJ60_07835 [Desulfobacterales bacterium S7086C20]|nr:MAG: hypothetical protein BBJ60_07835 [Desulfobacterales bacterium S7086C20]
MKIVNLFVATALAVLVLCLTAPFLAAEEDEFVEKVDNCGHINWSQWVIYANGIGTAPGKDSEKNQEEPIAPNTETVPFSNLFATIRKVRIDSSSIVEDLIRNSSMIENQLRGMVKEAEVVKREYLSNGTMEVTLAFKMKGGFAQLALPPGIKSVPQIKALRSNEITPLPTTPAYTGFVLDARGLNAVPSMSPTIVDESGKEVYGSAYISREFAVQQGTVAYERDLKSAQNNPRVSGNPLIIRALRTRGLCRCNFIISNTDASKVQSASENLLLLKKCKVIIVID